MIFVNPREAIQVSHMQSLVPFCWLILFVALCCMGLGLTFLSKSLKNPQRREHAEKVGKVFCCTGILALPAMASSILIIFAYNLNGPINGIASAILVLIVWLSISILWKEQKVPTKEKKIFSIIYGSIIGLSLSGAVFLISVKS